MILTSNYDLKMPVSGAIVQLEWNSVGSYQGVGDIWYDKSGNNNHFIITGSVGGTRPTYSQINGLDFFGNTTTTNKMYLSASQEVRARINTAMSASMEYTVMTDITSVSSSSTQEIASFFQDASDDLWGRIVLNNGAANRQESAMRGSNGTYYVAACIITPCYTVNTRQVFSTTFRAGDGVRTWNGTTSKAVSAPATGVGLRTPATGPFWGFGMNSNYGAWNQNPFLGKFYGAWVFPRRLSDSEISQMVTYINSLH